VSESDNDFRLRPMILVYNRLIFRDSRMVLDLLFLESRYDYKVTFLFPVELNLNVDCCLKQIVKSYMVLWRY
jgi:hypothetical protein